MDKALVVEVGANDGDNTEFFLRKGFRVVAIEPNPYCVERLNARFHDDIQQGSVEIISRAAYSQVDMELRFALHRDSRWSRLLPADMEIPDNITEIIDVRTIDYTFIRERWGAPVFLHVHINTLEAEFLSTLTAASDLPDNICAHLSSAKPIPIIYDAGYRNFKLVSDSVNKNRAAPSPALEGLNSIKGNGPGWSGFFGRELPGNQWATIEDMALAMESLALLRRLGTVISGDFSIHAKK